MRIADQLNPIELQNFRYEPLERPYADEDTSYNPGSPVKKPLQHKSGWRRRFSGWRGGVLLSIMITSFVLLLNVILAIIAATAWDPQDGIATSYTGDCDAAARWTTALHLLINLLSSLLLGASNYCMQRLVAPTRKEIDKAHNKGKWLDIGMPSVRNLFAISRERMAFWFLLGLSSVPLHFVYNSVVFETIAANNVDFLIVAPEFFTDKNSWTYFQGSTDLDATTDNFITQLQNKLLDDKYLDRTLFENITQDECITRYTASFITNAGAGFAVPPLEFREANFLNGTNSVMRADSSSGEINLQPYGDNSVYAYCLSEIVPSKCQVQFSQTILYIVICTNILKLLFMCLILWRLNRATIVTIGDAVQSFLERPDPTTEDCCLMSRRNVDTIWKVPEMRSNQRWQPTREHWIMACSKRRWIVSVILYVSALITAGALMGVVNSDLDTRMNVATPDGRNGFGRVNVNYLIDIRLPFGENSIIPYVLLANLPQAVVSFIYLTYNGLFTCMLAQREFSSYALKRAPLRVTLPSVSQRSTYFLQLPYSFSIPLLVGAILLHWFVSQSIFLARIAVYKDGKPVSTFNDRLSMYKHLAKGGTTFTGVGYSDAALLATIGWGSALVAICLLVAVFCKYPKGLPVGGTNSAVLSASCHLRYEDSDGKEETDEDITDRPLKWGVTINGEREKLGHCSFSDREVDLPRTGCLYAGTGLKLG